MIGTEHQARELELKAQIIRKRAKVAVKEGPKVVQSDITNWSFTFPESYQEGLKPYSPLDYQEFENTIRSANQGIDGLVKKLLSFNEENNVASTITGESQWIRNGFDRESGRQVHCLAYNGISEIEIYWKTFALPTFFESPVLGKEISIKTYELGASTNENDSATYCLNGTPLRKAIGFAIIDTGEGKFKPKYFGQGHIINVARIVLNKELERLGSS